MRVHGVFRYVRPSWREYGSAVLASVPLMIGLPSPPAAPSGSGSRVLRLLHNKKAGQYSDPLKSGKRDSSPRSRADAPFFRSPLSRRRRQLPRGAGREFFVSLTTKKAGRYWPAPERKTRLELATPTLARSCSTN